MSYALERHAKNDGKGTPESWLEKRVQEDLNDLKNFNKVFPEILVALAPLYKNEVLTAEDYLIDKLKFDYEALDQLAQRNEMGVTSLPLCRHTPL